MQKNILIIEDDLNMLNALASMVRSMGHKAITAPGGSRGLQMIHKEKPDMVLLDITMPVVDGFKILTSIQNIITTGQCTVIMVTSSYKREDVKRAISLGARDYIVKPVTLEKLKERIDRIFQEKEGDQKETIPSSLKSDFVSSQKITDMSGIKFRATKRGDILLVAMRGSADSSRENYSNLKDSLTKLFSTHDKAVVDIRDVKDISILNVEDIGQLLDSLGSESGVTLKLVSDRMQEKILKKGKFLRNSPIYSSPEDALDWF